MAKGSADSSDPWRTPASRAVGRALLDGVVAEGRIATAVAGDPGNVGRLLRRLHREGAVEIEAEGPPRIWRLTPGATESLVAQLEADQPRGVLLAGQRVLRVTVDAAGEAALARCLRSRALLAGVGWVARVEGIDAQYLLVLDRTVSAHEVTRLVAALSEAGITTARMLVEEVLGADAFVRSMASVRSLIAAPQ